MPLTLLLASLALSAQGDGTVYSKASLVASVSTVRPGEKFLAALRIKSVRPWHIYWRNPGDSGMPPSIRWNLPKGWKAGEILWPRPGRISENGIVNYVYEGDTLLPVWITPPKNAKPGMLRAKASWLVCTSEQCLTAESDLKLNLKVGGAAKADPVWASRLNGVSAALPKRLDKVRAVAGGGYVRVFIDVPGPTGVAFYPSDALPLDTLKMEAKPSGEGLSLAMRITEPSTKLPKRLRGLLVAPANTSWKGLGNVVAIDVAIANGG